MIENKYFIDTNIFLRVLVKEDNKTFDDCFSFLELVKNGKIKAITSCLVLAEVNWVLTSFYKFTKEDTIRAIKSIISLKNLKIDNKVDILKSLELYENNNVKFIDSLLSSNKRILSGEYNIVSYDKDFDKLGIKRIEPKDLIK